LVERRDAEGKILDPQEKHANRTTPRNAGRVIASRTDRSGKADFEEATGRHLETSVRHRDHLVGNPASTVQNSEGRAAAEKAPDPGASHANRLARARPNLMMMSRAASGRYLKSSPRSQGLSAKSLASNDRNLAERRGVTGRRLETTVRLQDHSEGSPALTVRNSAERHLATGKVPDLKEELASRLARALMGRAKTGPRLEPRASHVATGQLSVPAARKRIASAAHPAAVLRRMTVAVGRQRRNRGGEIVSRLAGGMANRLEIVVAQSDSDRGRVVDEADLASVDKRIRRTEVLSSLEQSWQTHSAVTF
jgi:hypothetical protein